MSPRRRPVGSQVRVLHSLPAPDGKTRFVDQMIGGAPAGLTVLTFTWQRALLSGYDVFHVHWPEYLVRHRTGGGHVLKSFLLVLLLVKLWVLRVPIVRTMHNEQPHEPGDRLERWLLRLVDARTECWVRLNPITRAPAGARSELILHGHYVERFAGLPRAEVVPGRLLHVGLIRPYKGVDRLLEVFRELPGDDLELRVVGRPTSREMREVVVQGAAADPRVTTVLEFVDDDLLVAEVTSAELVVLPYGTMHNSGMLLVVLSLGRPVLVPTTPTNRAVADEVGEGWVLMYDGVLEAHHIRQSLDQLRGAPDRPAPELSRRDWDSVGRQHLTMYRSLLAGGSEGADGVGSPAVDQPVPGR